MKQFTLFLFILFFATISANAQSFAVDKGAAIISGSAIFSNSGGDFFEDIQGNNAVRSTITLGVDYFIARNIYVGGSFEFFNSQQGNTGTDGIGLGPLIGYAYGNQESSVFPYFGLGVRYYRMNIDPIFGDDIQLSGSDLFFGFGVMVPVKEHVGVSIGGGYHMLALNDKDIDENYSGSIFGIGVGISGLFYN